MQRKLQLLFAIAILALSQTAYAGAPTSPSSQAAAPNQATVDITINDAGNVSVGGIDLSRLNVLPLNSQALIVAKDLNNVQLTVQGDSVTMNVQGTEVAKILWNSSSRQAVAALASKYGVQLNPDTQTRIEEWISSANVALTARYANEPSKPLNLSLSKYLLLDVGQNGQLSVEKSPLAVNLDPTVIQTIQRGGNQATVCWNKGTLNATVDGADLPTITLNPQGVQVLSKALNLGIENNMDSVLGSKLGVDVSLPGGTHVTNATCGQ